jgi:hypothetical protein
MLMKLEEGANNCAKNLGKLEGKNEKHRLATIPNYTKQF